MTREGSIPARCAIARTVVPSRPCSPNSTWAASRIRWAVAARLAARVVGSSTQLTLQVLSEHARLTQQNMSQMGKMPKGQDESHRSRGALDYRGNRPGL